MNKNKIIDLYGMHDGNDNSRYESAVKLHQAMGKDIETCFKLLVSIQNTFNLRVRKDFPSLKIVRD